MPCVSETNEERENRWDKQISDLSTNRIRTKKELDKVTDLLCKTLKKIEKYDVYDSLPRDVKDWHKQHKESDRSRKSK
jgi:hypothetical protein